MIVLGIEGTAHTISCGIVDDSSVLANVSSMYRPTVGGIHPREAASHHFENAIDIIKGALNKAGIRLKDVDLIGFSRGPGLGPSLRVTATAARALSLKSHKPIIGVNHPLGHIEISRKLSGALDPITLYVSGGNTQVIAHRQGRYRVFGETMDIGIGNLFDKFARKVGIPFPGGPKIEKLAEKGKKMLKLPYSVRGMDTSFSGILTAAYGLIEKGETLEDVSLSIQETTFSMLVEVLERGMHYLNKNEIILTGGVARNKRLREMVKELGEQTGSNYYLTDPEFCMDNGAMIAQAAMMLYKHGFRNTIQETRVDQRCRIDEVSVPWISESNGIREHNMGAEAIITHSTFYGRESIVKKRVVKTYRYKSLDSMIRNERNRNEYSLLTKLMHLGIKVPLVYDVDIYSSSITMQRIVGPSLKEYLHRERDSSVVVRLAEIVKRMHLNDVSHGDLTTGNVMISEDTGDLYIIDPSMGRFPAEPLQIAHDVFLLLNSFRNAHPDLPDLGEIFMKHYAADNGIYKVVLENLRSIKRRRRYV